MKARNVVCKLHHSRSLFRYNLHRTYAKTPAKDEETKEEREEREDKHDRVSTRNAIVGGIFAVIGTVIATKMYNIDAATVQRELDDKDLHLTIHEKMKKNKTFPTPSHFFRNGEMVDTMVTLLKEVVSGASNCMILFVGEKGIGKSTSIRTSLNEMIQKEQETNAEETDFILVDVASAGLYGVAMHLLPPSLLSSANEESLKSLHQKIEVALRRYSAYRVEKGCKKNALFIVDGCDSPEAEDVKELREIGKRFCDENVHVRFVFLCGESVADDLLKDARSIHVSTVKEATKETTEKYLRNIECPDPALVETYIGGIVLYMHEVKRILTVHPGIGTPELVKRIDHYLNIQFREINQLVDVSSAVKSVCRTMLKNGGTIRYGECVSILKKEFSDKQIDDMVKDGMLWSTTSDGLRVEFHSRAKKAHIERLLPRLVS